MDQRITTAIRYISEHLDEPLDLNDVARAVFVSPYHFHRLFKQQTSLPVKRFIESLKMERAFQVLLQKESKVQDVALALGYKDSETFSRAFKRSYKLSPDDLKRVVQKAMEQLNVELDEKQCIVIAFREESPAQITQKIMQTVRQKSLDDNVLDTIKAFSVQTSKANEPNAVKNKFRLQEEPDTAQLFQNDIQKNNLGL